MGSWQEKMRQIENEEEQRKLAQQTELALEQQRKQLELDRKLQQKGSLENIAKAEKREKNLKFIELLDTLRVNEALEDIRHQVWRGMGEVVNNETNTTKFIRLSFDNRTKIPEIEKKKWTKVVGKGSEHVEFSGWHEYNITAQQEKTRVIKEYGAVKPSYLEVGVDNGHLYILDTEVALSSNDTFHELAKKIGEPCGTSRTIRYTDMNGQAFNKEPHSPKESKWDWIAGPETHTTYSIANSHNAYYFNVRLSSELNLKKIGEFIDYGLALSCLMRTSEGKLPFQLK